MKGQVSIPCQNFKVRDIIESNIQGTVVHSQFDDQWRAFLWSANLFLEALVKQVIISYPSYLLFCHSCCWQGLEALDKNHVCTAYWSSRPLFHIAQSFQSKGNNRNLISVPEEATLGADTILRGLFKKANPEELQSLTEILSNNHSLVTHLLKEEIRNRSI